MQRIIPTKSLRLGNNQCCKIAIYFDARIISHLFQSTDGQLVFLFIKQKFNSFVYNCKQFRDYWIELHRSLRTEPISCLKRCPKRNYLVHTNDTKTCYVSMSSVSSIMLQLIYLLVPLVYSSIYSPNRTVSG